MLETEHLGFSPRSMGASVPASASTAPPSTQAGVPAVHHDDLVSLAELEKRHIFAALEKTGQNRTHAAKLLGISVRTLRNKLSDYGVHSKDDTVATADTTEEQ